MSVLDRFRLDDKVVVVTGASSGLGVAFAQAFAEAGADVVLGARRVDRLPETGALVEAAGRRYAHLQTDVTVPEQATALVQKALDESGRVDVLVDNAGLGWAEPASRETPAGLHPGALPQAAYAASKAGLIGLTRDLAAQWTGRKGIRVNAIAPGFFPTEMTDEMDPREAEHVMATTPAGRLGDPMELAAVGVFLASDAASYVTGITLPVDGGMTMP
jgi:NAD(P)-dependent dehydrogenase (short-subunit alcohol dehydrogenase family)